MKTISLFALFVLLKITSSSLSPCTPNTSCTCPIQSSSCSLDCNANCNISLTLAQNQSGTINCNGASCIATCRGDNCQINCNRSECTQICRGINCLQSCQNTNGCFQTCDEGGNCQQTSYQYTGPSTSYIGSCAAGGCTQECNGGGACDYSCSRGCQQACSGSYCNVSCSQGGCTQTCYSGTCLFSCDGGNCNQTCQGGNCTILPPSSSPQQHSNAPSVLTSSSLTCRGDLTEFLCVNGTWYSGSLVVPSSTWYQIQLVVSGDLVVDSNLELSYVNLTIQGNLIFTNGAILSDLGNNSIFVAGCVNISNSVLQIFVPTSSSNRIPILTTNCLIGNFSHFDIVGNLECVHASVQYAQSKLYVSFTISSCQQGSPKTADWVWIIIGIFCVIFLVVGGLAVQKAVQIQRMRNEHLERLNYIK